MSIRATKKTKLLNNFKKLLIKIQLEAVLQSGLIRRIIDDFRFILQSDGYFGLKIVYIHLQINLSSFSLSSSLERI